MTFSATLHRTGSAALRLDVSGRVLGTAAAALETLIIDTIAAQRPDTLVINVRNVTALSTTAVTALLTGYLTAINYGTSYRVQHAHGPARTALQTTGTLDVLTDGDDLGALLLAVLTHPSPHRQPPTSAA